MMTKLLYLATLLTLSIGFARAVAAVSPFPLRFYYPPAEQTSNPVNWAAAVKTLPGGQDVVTAKLFWIP